MSNLCAISKHTAMSVVVAKKQSRMIFERLLTRLTRL